MFAAQIDFFGHRILDQIEGFGRFVRFSGQGFNWIIRGMETWSRSRLLLPQFYAIGTRSIPVVIIVGGFIGMVLSVEAYDQFALMGMEERLGGVIDVSVVRQIGPVLAAVMIAGRVGGAVSAELGTMRVTEQIDALRVMGSDPMVHLVVPRVVACLVMVPILTVFSNVMGIFGGQMVTVHGYGVEVESYRQFADQFTEPFDLMVGLIKSIFFGLEIGLISCYKGFYCSAGAKGVGRAATESFVISFLAIIVTNLALAKFLKDLYFLIWGPYTLTLT